MSEMSSLSHEYASTSDFSRELNDAVLLLKRDFVRGESGKSKPEIEKALRRLRNVLVHLLVRLGETPAGQPAVSEVMIPEDVIARIESDHRGDRNYFLSDVKRLAGSLAPGSRIEQNDLRLLDSICTAADASASATFRKLWRR